MAAETLLVVGLLLVAVAILSVVYLLVGASSGPRGVARSMAIIEQSMSRREVAKQDLPLTDRLVDPVLDWAKGIGYRLSPDGATNRLAHMLDVAGNPRPWTVERIMGVKGVALILGALLGFLLGGLGARGILYALIGAAVLFFLPDLLVYNAGLRRQEELRKGLANSLDMLTVCVEAGQGFDSALLQVARSTHGPVAGEFARVLSEIQMGRSRSEAFALMAQRSTAPEVKNFVSSLVQADKLGIPIGQVLREQTRQMRIVRRQRAEEKAQQVTVKILFPLLLCIFPAIMIVIVGPGAIRIMEAFSGF
jgi:tight adherence protein C